MNSMVDTSDFSHNVEDNAKEPSMDDMAATGHDHSVMSLIFRVVFVAALAAAILWQCASMLLTPAMVVGDAFLDCDYPDQPSCERSYQVQSGSDVWKITTNEDLNDRQRVFLNADSREVVLTDTATWGLFLAVAGIGGMTLLVRNILPERQQ